MKKFNMILQFTIIVVFIFMLIVMEKHADAVGSFARQTGLSCYACHTVYPELTPAGRAFKLNGYNMGKTSTDNFPPLAAALAISYTNQKSLNNRVDPYDNDPAAQTNIPQWAAVWYGGKIYDRIGALAQFNYDGVGNNITVNMSDVRYANKLDLGNSTLIYGITVNNDPTIEDVWNTVPVWRFPQSASAVAAMPSAATLIDGPLFLKVGGIGIYGYWNNLIYAEASVYRTSNSGITKPFSAGTTVDVVTDGAVPYWRLALQKQWEQHSFEIGTYGLIADVFPGGLTNGPTDRFSDTAFDAQYQYISGNHVLSLLGSFIYEWQSRDGSYLLGLAANKSDTLYTWHAAANYYYRSPYGTIGGTFGYLQTLGSTDIMLYSPADTTGSYNGEPDSRGYIIELDYLPWEKLKISAQYIIYDKFNGSDRNYDGFGRNASDNNTFYLAFTVHF